MGLLHKSQIINLSRLKRQESIKVDAQLMSSLTGLRNSCGPTLPGFRFAASRKRLAASSTLGSTHLVPRGGTPELQRDGAEPVRQCLEK